MFSQSEILKSRKNEKLRNILTRVTQMFSDCAPVAVIRENYYFKTLLNFFNFIDSAPRYCTSNIGHPQNFETPVIVKRCNVYYNRFQRPLRNQAELAYILHQTSFRVSPYRETRERLDAKCLKKIFLRRERLPGIQYSIYASIPEVNFSVDNSRKRVIGSDFERQFYYIISTQSCEQAWF